MIDIVKSVIGPFWGYIATAFGAVVVFLGLYLKGRKDHKTEAKLKEAEAYRDTRKRMEDAGLDPNDDAALREWLRKYNRKQ